MGEVKKKAHSWRPFVEARAFARQLGLKSRDEWKDYSKSGKRPPDIPSNPEAVYKTEFKGFGDWLGTGAIATSRRTYRPFVEARAFVHTLGLKNMDEWRAYCKSGEKPADIPAYPGEVDAYRSEFKSWGDWLGTGTVASSKKEFRPFSEARAFVRDLGLRNQDEWVAYCRSGEKPPDIPTNPDRTYWLEFEGYGDWLGTGSVSNHDHHYRLFAEARAFVHTLKLKAYDEWRAYCKSGKKPADIPSQPKQVYEVEYKDMGDWLGTERTRYHRPFVEARAFTRTLGLRGYKQWLAYCRSGKKPADIPSDPGRAYRSEYEGIDDWLGAKYRPFAEARTFVHSLHLKNFDEWEAYRKSREKPVDIPSNPNKVYSAEYRGLRDWLGVVDKWDSRTLLTRLYELRPQLSTLDRRELYELLEQEGSFSVFRRALGPRTTPAQVLRELKDNNGSKLEQTLRNALDREAETSSVEFVKKEALAANGARAVDVFEQKNDSAFPAETQLTKLGETLNTDVSLASSFLYSQDVRAEASILRREEGEVTRIAQSTRTIEVFFCYAHEDRTWREELERHLSVLKRSGQIAMWHDRLIRPGAEWEREIDTHLNSTEIILLLVSPYFIASDYCWGVEMNRALEMHERGQAYVIPIIIRPVYWEEAPFAKLQVLPTGGKPITKWSDTHEAFLDVARGIHEVVKALRVRPQ